MKVPRMKRVQECDERGHFGWRERSAVRRHVAAALNHLPNDLIFGEMRGDAIECGAAHTAKSAECVAIVALLGLEDERALAFEWCVTVDQAIGNFVGGPRSHVRTPRCVRAEMRERRQANSNNQQRKHANRTAIPTFFAEAGDERQTEQYA